MFNFLERRTTLFVYLPLILYWILLFTLTSLPSQSVPSVGVNDKLEHMLAYFGLSFLLYLALVFQKRSIMLRNNAVLFTLLIIFVYSILDEVHQLIVPGRSCEFLDFLADMVGGIVGLLVIKFVIRFYKLKESPVT